MKRFVDVKLTTSDLKSYLGISREGIRHRLQEWTGGIAGPPA